MHEALVFLSLLFLCSRNKALIRPVVDHLVATLGIGLPLYHFTGLLSLFLFCGDSGNLVVRDHFPNLPKEVEKKEKYFSFPANRKNAGEAKKLKKGKLFL